MGALDPPALGLEGKAFGGRVGAFDDLQAQVGMCGVRAEFLGQGAARVAGIGPKHFEARLHAQDFRQDFECPRAIRDAGRGDHHAQLQARGIYHQMPC